MSATRAALRASYDRVAAEYQRRIGGELAGKPFDRALLGQLAREAEGLVCDLGCGTGHISRFLKDAGADVVGLDLSPGMLAEARRLHPDIPFEERDMTALGDVPEASWAAVVAFYSLIHVPRDAMVATLAGIRRALAPGGVLLCAFHVGTETRHLDDWWGEPVDADFLFFLPAEMDAWLRAAGFHVLEVAERTPYVDVETATRRAYLRAVRPPA